MSRPSPSSGSPRRPCRPERGAAPGGSDMPWAVRNPLSSQKRVERLVRIHPQVAGVGADIAGDEARRVEGGGIAILDRGDVGGLDLQLALHVEQRLAERRTFAAHDVAELQLERVEPFRLIRDLWLFAFERPPDHALGPVCLPLANFASPAIATYNDSRPACALSRGGSIHENPAAPAENPHPASSARFSAHCDQSESRPLTNASISRGPCTGEGVKRSRSVPAGHGRIVDRLDVDAVDPPATCRTASWCGPDRPRSAGTMWLPMVDDRQAEPAQAQLEDARLGLMSSRGSADWPSARRPRPPRPPQPRAEARW